MTKNKPQGWSIKKLGDICTMFSGGTPSTKNRSYWENGTIRWLSAKHLENDKILSYEYITQEGLRNSSAKLAKENDIILVTRVSVGKMLFCEKEYAINQDLSVIRASDYVVPKYLFFCLKNIIPIITHKSQGLAIKGITKSELANIPCVIPPIAEQKKIAEILGTWDRAIEQTQNLIAEKKELRRALATKLLSQNFWADKELSELLNYEQPTNYLVTDILAFNENKIPILTANKSFIIGGTDDETGVYDKGECVIFDDFTTDMKYVDFKFKVKSSAIKFLTPKSGVCLKFVFEQMKRIKHPLGGHKRYWLSEFQYLTISVPDMAIQRKIINILSKADSEINLLNKKLDVLKEQKKGLMQKLLTGEIRVKVDKKD